MRGLIPCWVIVNVALASGVPLNEVQQVHTSDEFLNLNKFYEPFTIIYKYVKMIPEVNDTLLNYSCDLDLNYGNNLVYNQTLRSGGYNYIIFDLANGSGSKIVSVNMKNCQVKELSMHINFFYAIQEIALYDEKYHIIFLNKTLRYGIYDMNGKTVVPASPLFSTYESSFIRLEINSKGLLVNTFGGGNEVSDLYFFPYNDIRNYRHLFRVLRGFWYGISTAANKLGFCAYDNKEYGANPRNKVICRQYDAEGQTKIMESVIPVDFRDRVDYIKVGNLDKGLVVMIDSKKSWTVDLDIDKQWIFMYIDEHGKQGKRNYVDVKCKHAILNQIFFKNSLGDYCISYSCVENAFEWSKNPMPSKYYTKCLKESQIVLS